MRTLPALLIACFAFMSAQYGCKPAEPLTDADLQPLQPDSISLFAATDSTDADGSAVTMIVFKTTPQAAQKHPQLTFTVFPNGSFCNDSSVQTMNIDDNGEAGTFVRSGIPGTTTVKVTTGAGTLSVPVYFKPALPDHILVSPAVSIISRGAASSLPVKAQLLRVSGRVSALLPVTFSDSTPGNGQPGIFLNTTIAGNTSEATSVYTLQDTGYHGVVYLKASVQGSGRIISGLAKVVIE